MGRKSALTDGQWVEIERRHLVDGQSINSLAKEFKVNESIIRRKIKPNKAEAGSAGKSLQALALRKIEAVKQTRQIAEEIAELPMARQAIVEDLTRKFTNVMRNTFTAAERGSEVASLLATMAAVKMRTIDPHGPVTGETIDGIKLIAGLSEAANKAGHMAITLMGTKKEEVERLSQPEAETYRPKTLDDFYSDIVPGSTTDPKLRITPSYGKAG